MVQLVLFKKLNFNNIWQFTKTDVSYSFPSRINHIMDKWINLMDKSYGVSQITDTEVSVILDVLFRQMFTKLIWGHYISLFYKSNLN